MKADDFGKFHGHPTLLKSALFPLKVDRITDKQMDGWMDELGKVGLIVRYDVNGKKYLKINDFGQRLRLMQSKFPDPLTNDGGMTAQCQHDDGVKGRGNEGEVETEEEVETREKEIIPPPFDLVVKYFLKKNIIQQEAQKFYDHYESNGWMVSGKSKMVNWHAAIGGWINRMKKFNTTNNGKRSNKPATPEQLKSSLTEPITRIDQSNFDGIAKAKT